MTTAPPARPIGIAALCVFFVFGAIVSFITCLALLAPSSPLSAVWRLKPQAQVDFQAMGFWAFLLMLPVSAACGFAAIGLWHRRQWGHRLALGVLAVNLLGDTTNAIVRGDARTLLGLPIGGAIIGYLLTNRVKAFFRL